MSSVDPISKRYELFCDQNLEEGHFDVIFRFGMIQDSDGNYVNNENEPIQELHVHSFILWSASKVFEKTLFGPLAHKGPIPVIWHSYDDFKEFITFLYLGKCTITRNNVMALVDLGEYYEVKLLKDHCDKFLTQNSTKIENVLKVYESLKIYSLENAMKKVMEFVAGNTVEILKTDEFLGAKKETVLDIAKMKNLTAKQEELFEAICKWGDHNCPEDTVNKNDYLKSLLADIITLIDFANMDLGFLSNFVVRKGFLFPSYDVLADILSEATTKMQKMLDQQKILDEQIPKKRRIMFTDLYGKKAFADISDERVITAIESMVAKSTNLGQLKFSNYINDYYSQWPSVSVGTSGIVNSMIYFIRDPSGFLSLSPYYINSNPIPVGSIIAPVHVPFGTFAYNNRCQIEFA